MSICKVFWNDVKDLFYKVTPELTKKIDKLSPSNKFPLYIVSFPYGDLIGDHISQFIPDNNGGYIRLNDPNISTGIQNDLGYGKDSSPLCMVLEKGMEIFVDAIDRKSTIPIKINFPGDFLNFSRILNKNLKRKPYAPNALLKATSGARTTFSLPYLTCHNNFKKLEREIGQLTELPSSQYDHWQLFKDITNQQSKKKWKLKLVYFSEKWVNSILNDAKWIDVKSHIFQLAWLKTDYKRNQYYFDVSFSMIKEQIKYKGDPFIADTARHILDISVEAFPGLVPAIDSNLLPLDLIQHTLSFSYGLSKYRPTIMIPAYYSSAENLPVYYSLQHPTLRLFTPKLKSKISVLTELEELSILMNRLISNILHPESIWQNTFLADSVNKINFKYVHTSKKIGIDITSPSYIVDNDPRFTTIKSSSINQNRNISLDANFFRGSVALLTN